MSLTLSDDAKARNREAARRYRAKHPERVVASQKRYLANNKGARKAATSKWYAKNPFYYSGKQRMYRGLPAATRPMPEYCECCGGKQKNGTRAVHSLCLDHDHQTHEFRGWLCRKCNAGIGMCGDTIEALEQKLAYLRMAYARPVGRTIEHGET